MDLGSKLELVRSKVQELHSKELGLARSKVLGQELRSKELELVRSKVLGLGSRLAQELGSKLARTLPCGRTIRHQLGYQPTRSAQRLLPTGTSNAFLSLLLKLRNW